MFTKLYLVPLAISVTAIAQKRFKIGVVDKDRKGKTPVSLTTKRYYIRNEVSGLVLDVAFSSVQPGADAILYTTNSPPTNNQLLSRIVVHLLNMLTDQTQIPPGTPLHQANKTIARGFNQRWRIGPDGYIPSQYNQSLVVWGQGGDVRNPGTRAVMDSIGQSDTQKWRLDEFQG